MIGALIQLDRAKSTPRGLAPWAVVCLAFVLAGPSARGQEGDASQWLGALQPDHPDRRCLQCHAQPHIAELGPADRLSMVGTNLDTEPGEGAPATQYELTGDEPATRPGLFVQPSGLQGSVHDGVTCVECHTDSTELPHKPKLNLHTCGVSCHAEQAKSYDLSTHMEALAKGDEGAPDCVTCHGGHNIESTAARDAPVYRLNIAKLCGDCHVKHTPQEDQPDGEGWINKYLTSAHAKAMAAGGLVWAATCVDCHGAHGVLPSADERSKVSRAHIPETCGGCHVGVSEVYAKSIHGQQLVAGNERAPVCSDCHASHAVTRATEGTFALDVINECGQCHDNPEDNGRIGTRYKSYLESYHGQATELGSRRAARCSDCHGTHDILPPSDPASRVYKARLKQTCGECHPGAGKKFVEFDPHANYRDSKNYPVLFGVWMYFMIMMSSVFTFFGLHTLLWFFRAKIEHAKIKGTHEAAKEAETAIRRFTLLNRINHALVVITFFGLTATGIPLVFSHENWANVMMGMFGGVHVAGTWHRFFATMLICNFAVHFYGLGRAFLRRKVTWYQWIFGPESLVPRWKDATDAAGMIKWFFVGGKVPKFDRWTYWEKFDYWAEVGGSMIIGGSGMLLWFPEIASWMFPGWMFNVAMIVHGYEALLAIGFIFTIHFFNAHLRPGVFPVDEVIFTGSMPEEEFKHHRPAEYERLVAAGRLDEYRVPAPSSRRKPLILATAIGLVSIGVVLLTLILIGGFSQL